CFRFDEKFLLRGQYFIYYSTGKPALGGKGEDLVGRFPQRLYTRYRNLSDELIVLPAHFMTNNELNDDGSVAEKLGTLFKENHGLNITNEATFRNTVTENLPPQPNAHQEISQTNIEKINPDEEKQREMEIGPNRSEERRVGK